MSTIGPKARIEQMLQEQQVRFMLHDNPQNSAYVIQRFSHEVDGCEVNLKKLAEDLSQKYGIEASFKKFNKGRSGRGHQISFDIGDIQELIAREVAQREKEAQEAELKERAQALELQMKALAIKADKEKPRRKKTNHSNDLESAIKAGLTDIISNQTVNVYKNESSEYRHYKGQYTIRLSKNMVSIQFYANALPNWPTTKNLYRHIAEQLGEKYDKKHFNRTQSGVATLSFSRKVCDSVFGGQLDIGKSMLVAYQGMLDASSESDEKKPSSYKKGPSKQANRF